MKVTAAVSLVSQALAVTAAVIPATKTEVSAKGNEVAWQAFMAKYIPPADKAKRNAPTLADSVNRYPGDTEDVQRNNEQNKAAWGGNVKFYWKAEDEATLADSVKVYAGSATEKHDAPTLADSANRYPGSAEDIQRENEQNKAAWGGNVKFYWKAEDEATLADSVKVYAGSATDKATLADSVKVYAGSAEDAEENKATMADSVKFYWKPE